MQYLLHKQTKVLLSFMIICAGILWALGYFLYYTKTPAYSVKLIREAVEQRDWSGFYDHVDTGSVLASAFDDVVEVSRTDADAGNMAKNLNDNFLPILKAGLVDGAEECLHDYVEKGSYEETFKDLDVRQRLNLEDMKRDTAVDQVHYKDIAYTHTGEDGQPIVGVIVVDEALGTSYTLDLQMRKNLDGTWRVYRIANLKGYIQEIKKAKGEKAAAKNKQVRQKIDLAVPIQGLTPFISQDASGYTKQLQVYIAVAINSEKPITFLAGNVYAALPDGKTIKIPFRQGLTDMTAKAATLTAVKELNPFLKADGEIIKNGVGPLKVRAILTSVTLADGTVWTIQP